MPGLFFAFERYVRASNRASRHNISYAMTRIRTHSRRATAAALAIALAASATSSGPNGPSTPKKRNFAVGNTLYVVPYAHLDTQWRWAYPQVIREFLANTLFDNFALIDKYPHYVFNFSGSRRYEMMKEYYPDAYPRLKKYIQDGRWFPCGSSVDEADANVPSAESLIRHVLYGNQFFRREFGVASQEYMLPDCFGFPYALPSILAHCGIKGFSTQKLTWGSAVGIPFKVGRWIGPDGKYVVAALDPGSYGADITEDLSQNTSWLARIQNTGNQSGAYVDYHYYGTGDTGGAPRAKAVDWVEKSIAGHGPITVISSRADEMFLSLNRDQIARLPQYRGELLLTQHSAGAISSQAMMKRWNRKNELLADSAERAAVGALGFGSGYPAKRLYDAWDLVLGSQMHDMLPGTSIPKAYEFCWNDELLAHNQFAAVERDAVATVSEQLDTRGKGTSVVVYNPLSIAREDAVEALVPGLATSYTAVGPDRREVPCQVIGREGASTRILFLAKVPSVGFAAYDLRGSNIRPTNANLRASKNVIENAKFKVTINADGDISSIFDKRAQRETLRAPARLALVYHNPSQFPAWNMDWADAKQAPREYVHGPAKIRIVEAGPVRVSIEIERETDGSKFVQQVRLSDGNSGERVEVANTIDWQTKERALKASFPLVATNKLATYELQVGAIERETNNDKKYEVPQHQWLDLTDSSGKFGAGILNDSKFGSDKPDANTVRLTLLYTPGVRAGYADQATQDFGRHQILYGIAPHAGDWRSGDVSWQARRLNQPLRAYTVPPHSGPSGRSTSLFSLNTGQVEISAIKKSETGNAIIVRLRELTGRPAPLVLLSSEQPLISATEVNGQEQPMGTADTRTTVGSRTLHTSIDAYSLRSFALHFKTKPVIRNHGHAISLPYNADVVSTDHDRTDGAFDAVGRTIAAEQLPAALESDGIVFRLGPTTDGAKNAIVCNRQSILVPAGSNQVYVLAASSNGDVATHFSVDGKAFPATVQDWGGFVGQWDTRLWQGNLGANFTNYGPMVGLAPGFCKGAEIAWYSSHRHHPTAGNEFYSYSYLYRYAFPVSRSGGTLTLPMDSRVKVLAISASADSNADVHLVSPTNEVVKHEETGVASISPSSGDFSDSTTITMTPPLYHTAASLRYTLDGTVPTANSPLYVAPITMNHPVRVRVASFSTSGEARALASADLKIVDTTPPKVVSARVVRGMDTVTVQFSEAISRESAEMKTNYGFRTQSGGLITTVSAKSALLKADGKTVELAFDAVGGVGAELIVGGVADTSPAGNMMEKAAVPFKDSGAVFERATETSVLFSANNVTALPVKASDTWTVNLFVKPTATPEARTVIGGFGRSVDGRAGLGRYFTIFPQGINFWISNADVRTRTALDIGDWQMLTATYDAQTVKVYKNGELIGSRRVSVQDDQAQIRILPVDAWDRQRRFPGVVRDFSVWDVDLSDSSIKRLWQKLQSGSHP